MRIILNAFDHCMGECASEKCNDCEYDKKICDTLTDYEDTGLTPEQVKELKERDTAKAPEHAPTGYGMICPVCGNLVQLWQKHCEECGQKLRED